MEHAPVDIGLFQMDVLASQAEGLAVLLLALGTLSSATVVLIKQLRPLFSLIGSAFTVVTHALLRTDTTRPRERMKIHHGETRWGTLIASAIALCFVSLLLFEYQQLTARLNTTDGTSTNPPDYFRDLSKLLDYILFSEDALLEMQEAVLSQGFIGDQMSVRFSGQANREGHYILIDQEDKKNFRSRFETALASATRAAESTRPFVLLLGVTDEKGSNPYNRKVSLMRTQVVKDLIRETFPDLNLKIFLIALGESMNDSTKDSLAGRFVQIRFVAPEISSIPLPITSEGSAIINAGPQARQDLSTKVIVTVESLDIIKDCPGPGLTGSRGGYVYSLRLDETDKKTIVAETSPADAESGVNGRIEIGESINIEVPSNGERNLRFIGTSGVVNRNKDQIRFLGVKTDEVVTRGDQAQADTRTLDFKKGNGCHLRLSYTLSPGPRDIELPPEILPGP